MSETDHQPPAAAAKPKSPNWHDLTEDLFGLNVRGVITLKDIFLHPARVFAAARTPDWNDKYYTPSIRLFFSLITVVILLRVFWAGDGSHFMRSIQMSLQNIDQDSVSAEGIMQQIIVSLPIVTMLSMILAGTLVRIWGKGTSLVVRLRCYFIAAIPSWILSYLSFAGMEFLPFQIYLWASSLVYFIIFVADTSTAYRGGVQAETKAGRVGKAILFGTVNFTVYFLSGIFMAAYSTIVTMGPAN